MDLREVYTPKILADLSFFVVAERSKASDHLRSFGQKLGWGPGESYIFFFFSRFLMVHNVDMP